MEAEIDPGGPLAPETDPLFAPRAAQERTIQFLGRPWHSWSCFQADLGPFPSFCRRGHYFQNEFSCFQNVFCFQLTNQVIAWTGCMLWPHRRCRKGARPWAGQEALREFPSAPLPTYPGTTRKTPQLQKSNVPASQTGFPVSMTTFPLFKAISMFPKRFLLFPRRTFLSPRRFYGQHRFQSEVLLFPSQL